VALPRPALEIAMPLLPLHSCRLVAAVGRAPVVAALVLGATLAMSTPPVSAAATPGAFPTDAEGFAFLQGRWVVHHRQLRDATAAKEDWVDYDGQARFVTLLDGLVSVEELRDAKGKPFGSAMRTFDREKRTWSDAWVSAYYGVLQLPQHGRFVDGVGTFESPDELDGKPMLSRGVWRRVSADVVTWEQAYSLDAGKTWKLTWFMRFERVSTDPFDAVADTPAG
jgi:hypothetical protein